MTALTQYQRLESSGLWREAPDAQRREVIVTFGDASIIITDKNERPLTHWSLAALIRQNPGEVPALFRPGPDAGEDLEIDDDTMVAAIETVMSAIDRRRPRRGRLRLATTAVLLGGVVALALFWLPGALRRHTTQVVPPSVRQDIGQSLMSQITRVSGQTCAVGGGQRALARLGRALLPASAPAPRVIPGGIRDTLHVPGGLILLNRSVVEDHEDPIVAAGFILAEQARLAEQDPLDRMLRYVGPIATFRLLTTGALPDAKITEYAEHLVAADHPEVPAENMLAVFEQAGVPSSPYAYALDITGESVLPLIEGDPVRTPRGAPILSDADWVRLQGICGA